MIAAKTATKLLWSNEEECNKIIDKMTEKNAKDTLKAMFKWIKSQHENSISLKNFKL